MFVCQSIHFGAGAGHHSPIGAYDEETDRVLVLDVARYDQGI